MVNNLKPGSKLVLLAGLLASGIVIPAVVTQGAQGKDKPAATSPTVSTPAATPTRASVSSTPTDLRSPRADKMYLSIWGIENVHVRETASGALIRFSFRVVDADKAKVLNDEKLNPILTETSTGARLGIPATEKVGKLRQVAPPVNGREYWMVFLNETRFVKPGSKVNIVIGPFHADGLVVEPSVSTLAVKKP